MAPTWPFSSEPRFGAAAGLPMDALRARPTGRLRRRGASADGSGRRLSPRTLHPVPGTIEVEFEMRAGPIDSVVRPVPGPPLRVLERDEWLPHNFGRQLCLLPILPQSLGFSNPSPGQAVAAASEYPQGVQP